MSNFRLQFESFLQLIGSPLGAVAIAGVFLAMFVLGMFPRLKWPALAVLLFCSTLSYRVDLNNYVVQFDFPLEQIRSQCRGICAGLLIVLLVPAILQHRGWRRRLFVAPAVMFFIFQMMLVLRMGAGGMMDRAVMSGAIYPIIFITLCFGAAKWLQDWKNVHTLVRCIAAAGIIFLLGTLYQFAINPSSIQAGGRLYGTTANPQMAGMLIALVLAPCCYLLTVPTESKLWRLFLIGSTGLLVLFLLWTGSRTGVLMALVAITLLFRHRLGRFLLIGSAIAMVVLIALQIFGESSSGAERILSVKDTRTGVWIELFRVFTDHLGWGATKDVLEVRENSYLATAANTGLFGLLPLLLAALLTAYTLFRLQRVRRKLAEHAMIVDLVTAALCSIAVGGFFEGILLGTMTPYIFCIYLYLAIATFIFDAADVYDQWSHPQFQQNSEEEYAYTAEQWVDADADPALAHEYAQQQGQPQQRAYPHV